VDVHALRCFIEVARTGGFTRAGRALHLTQPAVSKVVKGLEEELGATLLHRGRRRVRLTETGRRVLSRAEGVLEALRGLEAEVGAAAALQQGRLRLGLPPIVGMAFFPPLLAEFHQAHPAIVLELREEGSRQIESLILGHELDLGAVVLPTDEERFASLPFVHDELRVVLHPADPLARRRALTLPQLAGSPFVLYRPDFALHGHILEACRRAGFTPHVVSESSHWDFIVAMVAARIGLALLPAMVCRQLDARRVRSVRLQGPAIPWNAGLIWRRDEALSPAARAFLALCTERLRLPPVAAGAAGP
jgi:DNA-binding transcriptional LysR family regulator